MIIKATRISNLTDARYFASKEIDYLGFNIEEGSPDYVEPDLMRAFRQWVEGPRIVGEFGRKYNTDQVNEIGKFYDIDAIQIPADLHDPEEVGDFSIFVDVDWPEDPYQLEKILRFWMPYSTYYTMVVDESSIDKANLVFPELCQKFPLLIKLPGMKLPEIIEFTNRLDPVGIILEGSAEEKVGFKSFEELDEIFETFIEP